MKEALLEKRVQDMERHLIEQVEYRSGMEACYVTWFLIPITVSVIDAGDAASDGQGETRSCRRDTRTQKSP